MCCAVPSDRGRRAARVALLIGLPLLACVSPKGGSRTGDAAIGIEDDAAMNGSMAGYGGGAPATGGAAGGSGPTGGRGGAGGAGGAGAGGTGAGGTGGSGGAGGSGGTSPCQLGSAVLDGCVLQ